MQLLKDFLEGKVSDGVPEEVWPSQSLSLQILLTITAASHASKYCFQLAGADEELLGVFLNVPSKSQEDVC